MSLAEIDIILKSRRTDDWQTNPNIDAASQCILIAHDKLPLSKSRVLIIGTDNEDRVKGLVRHLQEMNIPIKIDSTAKPKEICYKYFKSDTEGKIDAPAVVIVGNNLRTFLQGDLVIYTHEKSIPEGLADPFLMIESLCRKYGSKLIRFNYREIKATEIAKQLFS